MTSLIIFILGAFFGMLSCAVAVALLSANGKE